MAFHYRTICCSRACATIYFARVEEARGQKVKNVKAVEQAQEEINTSINNEESSTLDWQTETKSNSKSKPKGKYKKKQLENESESSEQIEKERGYTRLIQSVFSLYTQFFLRFCIST